MAKEHDEWMGRKLTELTLDQLYVLTEGCTEYTCPYHGRVNYEIDRRYVSD